jgi:hypothetical protein
MRSMPASAESDQSNNDFRQIICLVRSKVENRHLDREHQRTMILSSEPDQLARSLVRAENEMQAVILRSIRGPMIGGDAVAAGSWQRNGCAPSDVTRGFD